MENFQRKSITLQLPTVDEIASKRSFVPISLILGIGLFFFSFVDLKCTNGQKAASFTGIQLITGAELKAPDVGLPNNFYSGSVEYTDQQSQKVSSNIWAILALLSALVGLIFFIKNDPKENWIGFITCVVGTSSLELLRFNLLITAKSLEQYQMYIVFKPAYWLAIIAFIVAGTISFFRLRLWQASSKEPNF